MNTPIVEKSIDRSRSFTTCGNPHEAIAVILPSVQMPEQIPPELAFRTIARFKCSR